MQHSIPELEFCRLGRHLVERTGDGHGTFPEVSKEVATGLPHRHAFGETIGGRQGQLQRLAVKGSRETG